MMRKLLQKSASLFLVLLLALSFTGCDVLDAVLEEAGPGPGSTVETPGDQAPETVVGPENEETSAEELSEEGYYTGKEEVALYLHTYGKLPGNYLTKREAEELGWEASKGNLWEVTERKSIGGDRFGNREGLLPNASGRKWYECDIDYEGGFRGGKRIVYSNDGLIYYSGNHYDSFEQLYDAEGSVR